MEGVGNGTAEMEVEKKLSRKEGRAQNEGGRGLERG